MHFAKAYYDVSRTSSRKISFREATVVRGARYTFADLSADRPIKSFGQISTTPPTAASLVGLAVDTALYFVLAVYLDAVMGGDHRAPLHPLFFLFPSTYSGRRRSGGSGGGRGGGREEAAGLAGLLARLEASAVSSGEPGEEQIRSARESLETDAGVGVAEEAERAAAAAELLAAGSNAFGDEWASVEAGRRMGLGDEGSPPPLVICDLWKVYRSGGRGGTDGGTAASGGAVGAFRATLSGASRGDRGAEASTSGSSASVAAVRGLSICANYGEVLCLLGPNGSGKTSTIGVLSGVLPPSHGVVFLGGRSVLLDSDACRAATGVCPQHDTLWDELTCFEHASLAAKLKGIPSGSVAREAEAALDEVGLLEHAAQRAGALSGGMRRRLSLALAAIGDPKLLFLDEPSAGLDPVNRRKLWAVVQRMKRGRVVLLTTHDMQEADSLADRVAVLASGRLLAIGTPLVLKTKLGAGFRLSLATPPGRPVRKLFARVGQLLPSAVLESVEANNALARVPFSERALMPAALAEFERMQASVRSPLIAFNP